MLPVGYHYVHGMGQLPGTQGCWCHLPLLRMDSRRKCSEFKKECPVSPVSYDTHHMHKGAAARLGHSDFSTWLLNE